MIYQIYPRSFQDSNGDGIGDLKGITKRLGYLQDLGVTGVWLSPFYPSPMADFGYDVADYCDVDPIFGTLKDFKILMAEAEKRDIKIIIDIVPNHTSDEHPWFKKSRSSKTNKYKDWYIWKDPVGFGKDGQPLPPNNWIDVFIGESAWQWVPERQQFYLHTFHAKQPDLNWQNHEARDALKAVLRFWMDLGVDGFRVDAVKHTGKDPAYRDNPANPDYVEGEHHPIFAVHPKYSQYWPSHFAYTGMLSEVLKEKRFSDKPRFMVMESYVDGAEPIHEYLRYYRSMDPAVAAPFIFEGVWMPWEAGPWEDFLSNFHQALEKLNPLALSSYAFSNHDQPRLLSRLGEERARAAAVLEFTLPGMIFVYNGEEIGMANAKIPEELRQDPGVSPGGESRDGPRTPMQWSSEKNAGFSSAAKTWLPVDKNYKKLNVEVEQKDKKSSLWLYKELIRLRKSSPAINKGLIFVELTSDPNLLVFDRFYGKEKYTTVVNFSGESQNYTFASPGHVVISSLTVKPEHSLTRPGIKLKPYEAVVIKRGD